jgi:putative Mg2+ transporter-C (MgtC) family protein
MHLVWEALSPKMGLATFVSETVLKLVVAAVLGGMIGIERELRQKPAGLRTNMFICFGAAMFTLLSMRYSHSATGANFDPSRITAQIIPGIGFIGAGAILHSGATVSGVTTAATLFVVASIGMAVGGGEYLSAMFATLVILVALTLLGKMEARFNFKPLTMCYEVRGSYPDQLIATVNRVMEELRLITKSISIAPSNGGHRVQFTVDAKHREHMALLKKLQSTTGIVKVETLRGNENSE